MAEEFQRMAVRAKVQLCRAKATSPALTGRFPQQVLPWLLLGTGLLAKVAKGMTDTLDQLAAELNAKTGRRRAKGDDG